MCRSLAGRLLSLLLLAVMSYEQALVVYQEDDSPLKRFNEKEKKVAVGDENYVLLQDWNRNGVAGVVWDSAIVLARYLLAENLLNGKAVLELGAGIGLPSMVAVKSGAAKKVISTDQPHALPLLSENFKTNLNPAELTRIEVQSFDWGSRPSNYNNSTFDAIIGADLVYDRSVFDALHETLRLLTDCKTLVVFASKIRYPKDAKFYKTLEADFTVEKVYFDVETDVSLFKITKNC